VWLYPYADDIHIRDTFFICVTWRDAFICVTWRDAFKSLAGSCASTTYTTWLAHTSCVPWLIHFIRMCAMTHSLYSYVWRDSFIFFICVTRRIHIIHMCDATRPQHSRIAIDPRPLCRDAFILSIRSAWLIHMIHTSDATHSYYPYVCLRVWHNPLTYDMCQVNFPYVWHAIFIHATRFIHMCGVLNLRVWHDPLTSEWIVHQAWHDSYRVATMSRLLKCVDFFRKRALQKSPTKIRRFGGFAIHLDMWHTHVCV